MTGATSMVVEYSAFWILCISFCSGMSQLSHTFMSLNIDVNKLTLNIYTDSDGRVLRRGRVYSKG